MFAIFNYAIVVYSYFVLRETAGKSLEEMEIVFGNVQSLPTGKDVDAEVGPAEEIDHPREVREQPK